MTIKELSFKIYEKLKGNNLSESFIHFFLESKIKKVNELLNINLNKKDNFSEEISIILEKIFDIYFYENGCNINKNLVINQDIENLKKINRNLISKTFFIAKIQMEKELKTLINSYKLK